MSLGCAQTEVVAGCRRFPDGTTQPVLIHIEYGVNTAGSVIVVRTLYTDAASVPITLGAGETVVPGCCATEPVKVVGDGVQIAGPTRAATAAFSGAPDTFSTSAIAGLLQSITVTAFATSPALPGQAANQVVVAMPGGNKIALAAGESRTWSVERGQDLELAREYEITAAGNAYATITWTVV